MPLYKTIKPNSKTTIFIWKVEETLDELFNGIQLTEKNQVRFNQMKSELHKKAFLAVRQLFKIANYKDEDIVYDKFGKPHLKNGKFISITHSFNFCAIIISEENPVGIDIEKQRDKIVRIADKFTNVEDYKDLNQTDLIKKLTVVWGAKESLYKIYGARQIGFKEHLFVQNFNLEDKKTFGKICYNNDENTYKIHFLSFEDFVCVYVY